jgi:hypothetical protein
VSNQLVPGATADLTAWGSSRINLSDANPASVPGIASPFAYQAISGLATNAARQTANGFLLFIDNLFNESGSTQGVLQTKQALHAPGVLHGQDSQPVHLYAGTGDISGLTLFSAKSARVLAGRDLTDISLYIQNVNAKDVSLVSTGRDLIAYNANSPLRVAAQAPGNALDNGDTALAGDIQISGPGTLEVLAGHTLDLGTGSSNADGTGVGLVSIGNARNPSLPFAGASIIAGAGLGAAGDLNSGKLDFPNFIAQYVTAENLAKYASELEEIPGLSGVSSISQLPVEDQNRVALAIFYLLLRDAGRDHNVPGSPGFGNHDGGLAAIAALFPGNEWEGDIITQARDIRTKSGGSISLFAPGGQLTLASSVIGNPQAPPGIITESGGSISIFTNGNVDLGISRIFTLRGGDEVIWSTVGNIAAGSSSKTVQSAPPTRVVIDPQSGDVKTDLAGLATGGGIGVLATVAGVPPGDVDLIAPLGTIDAGDAGIRVSGNINISASVVLNASNIQAGGTSAGAPSAPVVAAPNLGGLTAASTAAGAATTTANEAARPAQTAPPPQDLPSIITVEVVGYGEPESDDEEKRKKKKKEEEEEAQ